MPNDSSTGGPLVPSSLPPVNDASLDAILQTLVVALTGLPGTLVRPRWQPVDPKQPEPFTNWASIGVTQISRIGYSPAIIHGNDGSSTLSRHEQIETLVSFYGPNGQQYAEQCRDGLWLPQNGEALLPYGMAFVDASQLRVVPEFVNQSWIRRCDLSLTFNRHIVRKYAILDVISSEVVLQTDTPTVTRDIEVSN